MSGQNNLTKEQSDTVRLNWWFVNAVLQTDSESGETQSEFQYEAAMCESPDDFRRFIDMQMGVAASNGRKCQCIYCSKVPPGVCIYE